MDKSELNIEPLEHFFFSKNPEREEEKKGEKETRKNEKTLYGIVDSPKPTPSKRVLLLKSLMRMNLFKMFAPKSDDFFDSFAQSTRNLVAMSQKFKELLDAKEGEREGIVREIHDLEHVGDQITHNLFIQLSENFITPFDREDIHYLSTSLDDVADFINGTASRISLYQLK